MPERPEEVLPQHRTATRGRASALRKEEMAAEQPVDEQHDEGCVERRERRQHQE